MKKKIIILTALLFSTGISAQETLTLEQCREMALKYNKEMAASAKQTESARYTARSYKWQHFIHPFFIPINRHNLMPKLIKLYSNMPSKSSKSNNQYILHNIFFSLSNCNFL